MLEHVQIKLLLWYHQMTNEDELLEVTPMNLRLEKNILIPSGDKLETKIA